MYLQEFTGKWLQEGVWIAVYHIILIGERRALMGKRMTFRKDKQALTWSRWAIWWFCDNAYLGVLPTSPQGWGSVFPACSQGRGFTIEFFWILSEGSAFRQRRLFRNLNAFSSKCFFMPQRHILDPFKALFRKVDSAGGNLGWLLLCCVPASNKEPDTDIQGVTCSTCAGVYPRCQQPCVLLLTAHNYNGPIAGI